MTDQQQVIFEILKAFDAVCHRLDIRYFLVCGSALGAVKYKGFIPWDDDIDVALIRSDYEKLVSQGQRLLPQKLFLQNYKTDRQFPALYSKLRDSTTTCIEKASAHLNINHGMWIDIFPLDGYPDAPAAQRRLEMKKKLLKLRAECAFNNSYGFAVDTFFRFERWMGFDKETNKTMQKLERLISSYKTEGSQIICNHGNWQGKLDYAPREWFGEGTEVLFEGLRVRVPLDFDAYLTRKYGDWRAELPKNAQKSHHDWSVCDLDRPYTMYLTDENRQKKTK